MRLRNFENRVFIAFVLVTTVFFLWMVRGFLLPVFWAAVFAVLFQPLYRHLTRLLRGRSAVAALLAVLAVVLVVVAPSAVLIATVARQAYLLYRQLASGEIDLAAPIEFVERSLPELIDVLSEYGIEVDRVRASVDSAAVSAVQYVAGQALSIGRSALVGMILFGLVLYFLFYFFRDGERIIRALIRAIPMGDEREERLFRKFAEVARATVQGTLLVAVAQGVLGGIMFAIVGIEAAVFWGVVMGVLSLLPALGSALVWGPAAVILIASGALWKGVGVIIGGTLVIGLVDNLLRPIFVGKAANMPDYLVLLATLGGLAVFGLAGFVAGPVVAALFLVMWSMFTEEYAPLDSSMPPTGDGAAAPRVPAPPAESETVEHGEEL